MKAAVLAAALLVTGTPAFAQHAHEGHHADMDSRGLQAMGFDQTKIRHTFTPASDGGSIEVAAKDPKDADTIARIRTHLKEVSELFARGDFSKPVFIHARTPPGAEVMKARRDAIAYRYEERPSGGRVTIKSSDPEAVAAIGAFLRFQAEEHHGK